MGEQARVTVVIPAYKAEKTVRRAVDSVLAQQGVDVDAVVVVDGLLDRTAERLQDYDPGRVTVIVHPENRGSQVSRNAGLTAATGEFVMFLDCDDFIEGPLLSGLVRTMREEAADIAFGPMQVLKEASGRRRSTVYRSYASADDLFRSWMALGRTLAPCAILWRTDFLRGIGGWNEQVRRNQDGEVVIRSVLRGARIATSREGRGIYVSHDSADRITTRPENLPSAIDVGELILASSSEFVSDKAKREGLAGYFYRIALRLDSFGRPDLAERAWNRARELGHGGPKWHRLLASSLGLPFRTGLFRLNQTAAPIRLHLRLTALLLRFVTSSHARR